MEGGYSNQTSAAPVCPQCGHLMIAGTREMKHRGEPIRMRIGSPPPPRREQRIWECTRCGILRAPLE